jgi:hypothetical protein
MPKDAVAKARMARKLRSKAGSAIYAQRKAIVETMNGQGRLKVISFRGSVLAGLRALIASRLCAAGSSPPCA